MFKYIKEGSTVSVMRVVQQNGNFMMIVSTPQPILTGCQSAKCILPASPEGIVLRCEDSSKIDVISAEAESEFSIRGSKSVDIDSQRGFDIYYKLILTMYN